MATTAQRGRPGRRAGGHGGPAYAGAALATVLVAAACLAGLAGARAQDTGQDAYTVLQDADYQDAERGFEVTVPAGWTRRQDGEALALTGPDGELRAWLLTVPAGKVADGVAAAWRLVAPDAVRDVVDEVRPPLPDGIDEAAQFVYRDAPDRSTFAVGYLAGGTVYVLLMDGPVDAVARRQAQVSVLVSSFDLLGRAETDLTAVPVRPLGPAAVEDLDGFIPVAMAAAQVPGGVVSVVQDGRVVYQRAFGVKEVGKPAPMTLDTQLMIGSSGKSLTTLLMATLVDDGRFAWDTPVVDILPSFRVADPELSARITMENLVCACSGVPRRDYEFILNAHTLGAEDVVRSLADFRFFTPFGETFQYSNQMVASAGYVAGVAAGGRPEAMLPGYVAALQARVLGPIGMPHTTVSFGQVEARGDFAAPHGQTLSGARVPIPLAEEALLTPVTPAGAVWSTAPDMARYLRTLLAGGVAPNGQRVVSPSNLERLWTPQVKVTADTSYGLGWMIVRHKGLRVVQHAGNTFGFTSGLALLPDRGLGVVVLTNARASNAFNEAVVRRVIDLAFGQDTAAGEADFRYALTVSAEALDELAARTSEWVDAEAVSPHLGSYRNAALGDLALALERGHLIADAGEVRTALWRYTAADGSVSYLAADPPLVGLPLRLTRDAAGAPTVTLVNPPERYVFERAEPVPR